MKLTGKAKGMFTDFLYSKMMLEGHSDFRFLAQFSKSPESMQWGVYQDWADSLGLELYVDKNIPNSFGWGIFDLIKEINGGYLSTRQEARNAALEKLNEIINEK
jgi:hypothetical protein